MPKILIADDNSNVHRTVTLALADLGVEVITVNNGEAAVRKLSGVSPDLILADIFMPVRNGYEVCEYVKSDARFKNIPVVLLLGAFDPFDEREAQRVGADGILKKPFVPPDPLITMVKTLLDRVLGERLVPVSFSKISESSQERSNGPASEVVHSLGPEISGGSSSQEFEMPAGRVAFGEGDRPVAFGALLETPTAVTAAESHTDIIEPVDDEQILTSQRDATLGEPIFWRNDAAEEETEIEPAADDSAEPETPTWDHADDSLLLQDESVSPPLTEPLELVREEQEETSPSHVDSGPVVLDPAAQSPLTVAPGEAPELAANPLEWLATAPVPVPEEPTEIAPASSTSSVEAAHEAVDDSESPAHSNLLLESEAPNPNIDAQAVDKQTVESRQVDTTAQEKAPQSEVVTHATPSPNSTGKWEDLEVEIATKSSVPAAHDVPLKPDPAAEKLALAPAASHTEPPNTPQPFTPDPALVEAVVQRVLDKMRPQVVDIITREFLRPIVQALVHREIEKQ